MSKIKHTVFFSFLICFLVGSLLAQERKGKKENLVEDEEIAPADSNTKPKFVPRPGEKFDIIFSYVIPVSNADPIAPMSSTNSGNISLQLSFNRILSKRFAVKFMPGISWYNMNFSTSPGSGRKFPTPDTSLSSAGTPFTSDVIRLFYIDLPIATTFTIQRDDKERPNVFIDLGASIGIRPFEGSYERSYGTSQLSITEKFEPVPNVQRFRGTVFTRIVYRFIGLHFNYRFTDVFLNNQGYGKNASEKGSNPYPRIPSFELGLTIVL